MSDFPPPPPPGSPPPPPPPGGFGGPPPGYTAYGEHLGSGVSTPRAGFWIRFAAAIVDGLIYGIPTSIVAAALGVSMPGQRLLSLLVGFAYFVSQESGATGQTLGKKLCGIRVVDQSTGQTIDAGRAMVRYLTSLLSGLVCGLGYLWMLWDGNKQTWHDKSSQTLVVKA
jgi:uncharacterized RDD family membrane protein YckC